MYWWKLGPLRTALATRTLPEQASFLYLFLMTVFTMVFYEFLPESDGGRTAWDDFLSAVAVAMTALGTCAAYRSNGGGAGQGFLERYMALSFVLALRVVLIAPFYFMAMAIVGTMWGWMDDATGPFDVVTLSGIYGIYYAWLVLEMGRVADEQRRLPAAAAVLAK
ncbi:MAG TPA: hypothetical protein VEL28_19335 [Candidatus Binatia bacterium]|nr:hypothetical protein [Candidatus Binatia bacterium]